jgi:hypothetical protein
MKSLLFQEGASFSEPPGCSALPCRQEATVNLKKNGRIYRFVVRDRIVPEDPLLMLTKAIAFSIQTGEAYNGTSPSRALKDFLIKDSVVI